MQPANADRAGLADIRSDMEKLTQKTLEMFPRNLRQIVSARLVRVGDKERTETVSATAR